jgi:two-component system, OmpR family, sensor histidine kinase TctE
MAAASPELKPRRRLPAFVRSLIDTAPEATAAPVGEKALRRRAGAWGANDAGVEAGSPAGDGAATPAAAGAASPAASGARRPNPARWRWPITGTSPFRSFEQRSLFGEILDWMFAPLLLLWPLSVAVTFVVARSLADAPFDRALIERTEALAQQVQVTRLQNPILLPRAPRDFLSNDEIDLVYYQVIGPRGRLLAGDRDLPGPRIYDFPEPGRVKLRNSVFRGDEVRIGYLHVPMSSDAPEDIEDPSHMLLQVAETLDKRNRLANEIIKGVIFPQFMILPLALMLVWFGLSRGLAPLQSLQRRIRDRRPDDLSPIDPNAAPEEIAPLVDAFNDLLLRLRENVDAQKRFIADAAHQMKTPLAGLRTQSELALRESNPDEQRRTLEQLAVGSQRAAHLITQLLALARTENLRERLVLEPLELCAFSRAVVADWVPAALERRIDFGFEAQCERATLDANPILLRELFNNLIDNALRYTPAGGTVTVRIRSAPGTVSVEVEDSGPGVPDEERRYVFERFYRVLGTDVDGSGLGLAIVREIAEQHLATVRVEPARPDVEPPGARFVVEFPATGG